MAKALVRVSQKILHGQLRLCHGLPNRQRRERVRQRAKTDRNTGRGPAGDRKRGDHDGSVLSRLRGRERNYQRRGKQTPRSGVLTEGKD